MPKIYYNLIIDGKLTIDEVPAIWQEKVQALLDADK